MGMKARHPSPYLEPHPSRWRNGDEVAGEDLERQVVLVAPLVSQDFATLGRGGLDLRVLHSSAAVAVFALVVV